MEPTTKLDARFSAEAALVFAVAPDKVLGFRKGVYSQTRWRC
ncbi:hypothetical protein ACFLIM_10775 [Nonomuraea sp. M3C6]|uniref:Uncharacterized protein n=1 Tax=Nonomuraea marmarensis TaxID=3351344 RepID=A0ABW7A8J4_9ACTN